MQCVTNTVCGHIFKVLSRKKKKQLALTTEFESRLMGYRIAD